MAAGCIENNEKKLRNITLPKCYLVLSAGGEVGVKLKRY